MLERAPSHRALGHFIGLKAEGVRVLDRLGLREPCAAAAMPPEFTIQFRDAGGHLLREEPTRGFARGLDGYLLLRRSDLHQALYTDLPPEVEVSFGVGVESLTQGPTGVTVRTTDQRELRADLLVGADGVHSAVRRLMFGDQGVCPLGGTYVALEVEWPGHPFATGRLAAFLGRGRMVAVAETGPARVVGIVYHGGEDLRSRMGSTQAVREVFAREYAAFHPDVRALFAAIDDRAFVFRDVIQMVELPSLVSGRVALLGDAGSCPTFLSGMGSALAMLGAEVLAERVATTPDVDEALQAYSAEAQAMAAALQRNARKMARVILGRSWFPVFVRNSVVRLTPRWLVMSGARRFYDPAAAA